MFSIACLLTLVHGHGFLIQPEGINGQLANKVNEEGMPCGPFAKMPTAEQMSAAVTTLAPGDEVTMTYVIQNGDGSGPMNVQFDTTGTGKFGGAGSSGNATVTQQVPGKLGNTDRAGGQPRPKFTPTQFSFVVPQDLNCPNGCLMRLSQADRQFGACAVIKTGAKTVMPPPANLLSPQDNRKAVAEAKKALGLGTAKKTAKKAKKGQAKKAKKGQAKKAKKGQKQAKKQGKNAAKKNQNAKKTAQQADAN